MVTVKELADLCVDALMHAGLIVDDDTEFERASEIIEEEIKVRMCVGGIVQPEEVDK